MVNAYQLAVTISLLPLAALGEIVGYRRVYRVGMALFTAGLAGLRAVAFAGDADRWRASCQGFGAAGHDERQQRAGALHLSAALLGRGFGVNVMVGSTSSALGPSIAAAILSVAGWQWLFAVNVPIGVAGAGARRARPCRCTPRASHRFDWAAPC